MDWFWKAVVTAGAVMLAMAAARRCGPRLAGIVAALPTVTAPALAWLAHDRGVALAISAAIASVSVCAMLAAFALGYAVAARRAGPLVALLSGVGGGALMAAPALAAAGSLHDALPLACACCALAFVGLQGAGSNGAAMPCTYRRMTIAAAATGTLAALVTTVGPTFGGFATGLLASLPLIGGGVAVTAHVAGGHGAATHFLRGYVWGLFGKILFGVVFAVLAPQLGVATALVLACGCAVVATATRRPPASRAAWTWPRPVVDPVQR